MAHHSEDRRIDAEQDFHPAVNRREFLAGLAATSIIWPNGFGELYKIGRPESGCSAESAEAAWERVPQILARISAPSFPNREWNVRKFGAVGDNKTDCSKAFREAIAACHAGGGGKVIVPEGEYSTGAIRLLSGVNLEVQKGATIRFSRDPGAYPLVQTQWEGVELMNFSPFIYAWKEENIALTGEGALDGNSDCEHWWPWKGRKNCGWKPGDPVQEKDRNALFAMGEKNAPVEQRIFGIGHYLRPQFIQPNRCKNVLIEGLTLLNSPMWQVTPALCTNVTVRGLTIESSGPNTDGCDPASCRDVLIENCTFNTGDDCIAIKSGRNGDGRRVHVPSENIVIRGCHMKNGHGGVTIGSEISGGVRNVFVENCQMDSPHLDSAIRIKNNAMRGGTIENIHVRNINVGQVATAGLSIDFLYEEGAAGNYVPVVRCVDIRNLKVENTKYPVFLRGLKNAPIEDIRLTDCVFENTSQSSVVENASGVVLKGVRINGKLVEKLAS
ncbi:MAG TPA: glycoside hydrolase family 28 protein [Candidatus Acidoferrum sp.]|nr:glycoside hydrolase family 28 protein [Candidatus Acidoferrum sp.]